MTDLRLEYPRPQLRRDSYLSLNGEWEFEIDNAKSGLERELYKSKHLSGKIIVPYCPESKLSGVEHTDFMNAVWYRKDITLPPDFAGKRVLLHIGACDYETTVWVNGTCVGSHRGGYTPFFFDITEQLCEGKNSIAVYAQDDVRSGRQPAGKQSTRYASYSAWYTRTTGIWQSVWMEALSPGHILSVHYDSDIDTPALCMRVRVSRHAIGERFAVSVFYEGREVGHAQADVYAQTVTLTVPLSEKHLWDIGEGNLYDLTMTLSGGDRVESYFGLRRIGWDKKGMTLNGRYFFGRYVLDQGFYEDGIYTAPSDARLKQDILDSMALGFNGARAHEKVFEPRYFYHADKLGYLVWGEHGDWGLDISRYDAVQQILPAWLEQMERDGSHPSLIGWCPFNEAWDKEGRRVCDDVLIHLYRVTKAVDPTRPCIGASGGYHRETDVFDVHTYEQNPHALAALFCPDGTVYPQKADPLVSARQSYDPDKCLMVSEFGGTGWSLDGSAWSYGNAPLTGEEFLGRYRGLVQTLLDCPSVCAFCYTQLTDVEQEQNGLLTYDRRFKFACEQIRQINTRKAKIEE